MAVKPPATHSQPSRKGKKAWRKNVDLAEVEKGLETVRDEIIQGGVVAEKTSDELFTTDIVGDDEIEKKHQVKKPLKADQILAQRSAVPALPGRKRKIEDIPLPSDKKPRNGTYVSYKELQRLRRVADSISGSGIDVDESASHDPWAIQSNEPTSQQQQLPFLDPAVPPRAPGTLKRQPKPLTLSGRAVAHVRKPDGGKSYNPSATDYSSLHARVSSSEVSKELSRLAAAEAQAAREARAAAEAAKVEAAEREAYATDVESEWEGFGSEHEGGKEVFTAKPKSRKTKAERNKALAKKERERELAREKEGKARAKQEARIGDIAKEVAEREKTWRTPPAASGGREAVGVDSEEDEGEDGDGVKLARKRFGLAEVPAVPLELTLPDELQDSLRRLRPEGNLLTDRYRNLLINGKLEVRRRAPERRTRKTYRTEKWSYKDWKLK